MTWPGVEQLKEFKKDFPKWKTQSLQCIIPQLDEEGIDLLQVILKMESFYLVLISPLNISFY